MTEKQRLDKQLSQQESQLSRTQSQRLITEGQVTVNGSVITQVAFAVDTHDVIELLSRPQYVSRGGEKLAGAIDAFKVKIENRICLDLGASTGGFTDYLLQHGAQKVYAVDVGENQLVEKLRSDSRVASFEKMHANQLSQIPFTPVPNLTVIDVSFISLKKVLPYVFSVLESPNSEIIALVKPQFEFGDYTAHKNFDRLNENEIASIIQQLERDINALSENWIIQNQCKSPITGGDGTQEYFFHIKSET